jgi:hypothetical protein
VGREDVIDEIEEPTEDDKPAAKEAAKTAEKAE